MAHDHHHHPHAHEVNLAAVHKKSFLVGIVLNSAFVVAEVVAGLVYHSVALLTDAGHNLGDVASLLISLWSFFLAQKKSTPTFTYGYKKTTILAALINAVVLFVGIGILGYESIIRLQHPQAVQGSAIAWVAALGIAVNAISAFVFFKSRKQELNVKSAYLHLLMDALVSLGVVIGGVLIAYTHWYWIDPVIGLIIMLVIFMSTWSLLKDSFKMVVDAVPSGIDLNEIIAIMEKVQYVDAVHHVHIWPLSTTENALTAHVVVSDQLSFADKTKVVQEIRHQLEHHNVHHSTIELEVSAAQKSNKHCTPH